MLSGESADEVESREWISFAILLASLFLLSKSCFMMIDLVVLRARMSR